MRSESDQQPVYPCSKAFAKTISQLKQSPGLITTQSIDTLKDKLALAATGKAFVLHAGDCAEDLHQWSEHSVTKTVALIQSVQSLLQAQLKLPVIPIGRIAGQYFKPRTHLTETRGILTLPSYQGDGINRVHFTLKNRTPDPSLLLQVYDTSKKTLALIGDLYTSHEALHLAYERSLTRHQYNLSAHLVWAGVRTNALDSPYVTYLRTLYNPIAVKIGPNTSPEHTVALTQFLNPKNIPGKLTLIHRFGAHKIQQLLPSILQATQKSNIPIIWSCDPMHGNTEVTEQYIKTRKLDNIMSEIQQAFSIHAACNSQLNGLHLELTGDNVTECSTAQESLHAYKSLMDPRLNPTQALALIQQGCFN